MPDEHPFRNKPQRQAIPRMLVFLAVLVVLAVAIAIAFERS